MPVLPGVRAADIFSVVLEVRQDIDLGVFAAVVALTRGTTLNFAELFGKALKLPKLEMLARKAQHPVAAEAEQDMPEILADKRLCQINAVHRRP